MKCYNCGPGAPAPDDRKILCLRCSDTYTFTNTGQMVARQRDTPPSARIIYDQAPRQETGCPYAEHWDLVVRLRQVSADLISAQLRIAALEAQLRNHGIQ